MQTDWLSWQLKFQIFNYYMKTVKSINFAGKRALIRVDFNVPLDENLKVTDDTRIQASLATIDKILNDGGSCILMSHLGRPKKGPEDKFSLKHIISSLEKLTNLKVKFADDCVGDYAVELSANLQPGEVLLLENLRFYPEEEKGDRIFAEKLSKLGDVYVNDAFGTAHRAHASTTIVADFFDKESKCFGLLMAKEVESGNKVLKSAEKPFTAIIGGAKISSKIDIVQNLLEKADNIIIGGGMAFTFFKAMGGQIGSSLVEEDKLELAAEILKQAKEKGVNILLPTDAVIADGFSNEANHKVCPSNAIPDGWMGLDIGEKAIKEFAEVILNSKTILWNGPMGVFEMDNFNKGTKKVAEAIAQSTLNGAFSLVGGGDSVAAVNQMNISDKISYVSTGGGAMLEFFEGKTLPGVAAIH
jgi:phosphoglycerate kinase